MRQPGVVTTSQPGPAPALEGPPRSARRSLVAFAVALVLGAAVWGGWLAWDHTASYDVVTGTQQSPYVTLQVLGCALTVGVVVALLAALRHPLVGAGGVAAGFWVAWTADAASTDETGLFAIGAVLLLAGPALGTAVAAGVGAGVGALLRAGRRRRTALTG